MGTVILFKKSDSNSTSMEVITEKIPRSAISTSDLLEEANLNLEIAANIGGRVVEKLKGYGDSLGWTVRFCTTCLAATELSDLSEMVRQRDELFDTWNRRGTAQSIAPRQF